MKGKIKSFKTFFLDCLGFSSFHKNVNQALIDSTFPEQEKLRETPLQSRHTPWCMQPRFLQWCGRKWRGLRVFVPGSRWLCSASRRGLECRAAVDPSPLPPAWSDGLTRPAWSAGPQYLTETKRFTTVEPHWISLGQWQKILCLHDDWFVTIADRKRNILWFWTVGQTKQTIWRHYFGL